MLVALAAGCGEEEGAAEGATVTAYVDAPLCVGARQELARQGGSAGNLSVQVTCLPSASSGKELDLAALGANARRATEDSTAVAYLEASDPAAARFIHPILEAAEVPWISQSSGKKAMAELLQLIASADAGSLRESIQEALRET